MEHLLAKYFSGEATKQEQAEVQDWRNLSEENSHQFLSYKLLWLESKVDEEIPMEMLETILNRADIKKNTPIVRSIYPTILRVAAVITIMIGSIFVIYNLDQSTIDESPVAASSTETLEDGTKVTLHANSSLKVEYKKELREVYLTGKAYFDVERDENRPFVIHTTSSRIEVLGTSFVVDTYLDEDHVLVESGTVLFSNKNKTSSIKLTKGEMGILKNKLEVVGASISNVNYMAWVNRKISFRELTLDEVAVVLKDVYNLDVVFSNERLKNCKLSADFNNKTKEEVVGFVARVFSFDYLINEDQVIFSGEVCQ